MGKCGLQIHYTSLGCVCPYFFVQFFIVLIYSNILFIFVGMLFDKSIVAKQIPALILSRNNHTVLAQGFLYITAEGSDRKI